jgi:hypothetical protein
VPFSAWLSGKSAVAVIANPSPRQIVMMNAHAQRVIHRIWQTTAPANEELGAHFDTNPDLRDLSTAGDVNRTRECHLHCCN